MKLKHFTLAFLSVFLFGFFFYNSSIKAAESQTVNVTTVDIDTLTPTELSNMIIWYSFGIGFFERYCKTSL